MKVYTKISRNPGWLIQAILFFRSHFIVILSLGLVAALGRATQLGAFGEITPKVDMLFEIIIQSSRLLIFIYTLGLTNIQVGLRRMIKVFTSGNSSKENWCMVKSKLKKDWSFILMNVVIYLLISYLINLLIDYTAYQTCLFYKLKTSEIISDRSSEWVLILFFKNLSVIPFSLVFNGLFLLWITNKINSGSFKPGN